MKNLSIISSFLLYVFVSSNAFAQYAGLQKNENIVYGMTSGSALLMDEYLPQRPNHKAIIFIPGSAWGFPYPQHYDHPQLKDDVWMDSTYTGKWVKLLVQHGFTVFVINHRFAPRFQYPDIIDDCQRAVRYVRSHAKTFGIDPLHIGAMGISSGANLASMLGVIDTRNTSYNSAKDSVSSKVQAVVTLASPFNLADFNKAEDSLMVNNYALSVLAAYMGGLPKLKGGDFVLSGKYVDVSPFALVNATSAPTLIYYSDNDPIIPVRQAKAMYEKLKQNKVPAKIFGRHHEEHSPVPDMAEVNNWFDTYLN